MVKVQKPQGKNKYLSFVIIAGVILFIFYPLIQYHESKYWYHFGSAIIALSIFAAASAWVIYATITLSERLKYLLTLLLILLIIFLEILLVAMLTPIYSFIYLGYMSDYLCNGAMQFFVNNFNDHTLVSICHLLKP